MKTTEGNISESQNQGKLRAFSLQTSSWSFDVSDDWHQTRFGIQCWLFDKPTTADIARVKRVLRYLSGTLNKGVAVLALLNVTVMQILLVVQSLDV